jgi:hypothetical protein
MKMQQFGLYMVFIDIRDNYWNEPAYARIGSRRSWKLYGLLAIAATAFAWLPVYLTYERADPR